MRVRAGFSQGILQKPQMMKFEASYRKYFIKADNQIRFSNYDAFIYPISERLATLFRNRIF